MREAAWGRSRDVRDAHGRRGAVPAADGDALPERPACRARRVGADGQEDRGRRDHAAAGTSAAVGGGRRAARVAVVAAKVRMLEAA